MSKRSKACDFSIKVKKQMIERDNNCCIICGSLNITPAHYISRSKGGLGVIENGVCLCVECHTSYDNSKYRHSYKSYIKNYLDSFYPNFTDEQRKYRKW